MENNKCVDKGKMIIFGAGQQGQRYVAQLKEMNIEILFVCDNDPNKIGTSVLGIPIMHPNEIAKYAGVPVFIATVKCDEIKKQLISMGIFEFYEFRNNMSLVYKICQLDYDYKVSNCNMILTEPMANKKVQISIVVLNPQKESNIPALNSIARYASNYEIEVIEYIGKETIICGEHVLLLNATDWLQKDTIENLLKIAKNYGGKCVVGPKILSKEGMIYSAGRMINTDGIYVDTFYGEDILEPLANYVKEVDAFDNSGILMNRENWNLWMNVQAREGENEFWSILRERNVPVIYQPLAMLVTDRVFCKDASMATEDKEKLVLFLDNKHKYRGNMLLVDDVIARYDQNTGARCVKQYLEIFKKLNMNVLYMPMNFDYDTKYTTFFQQMGICVLYGEFYQKNYKDLLLKIIGNITYSFLNRPVQSEMVLDVIKQNPNMNISYFGHDLHHKRMMREYELTHDEEIKEKALEMEKLEHRIVSEVDYAGYPSQVEVDYMRLQHSNVYYYPLYYFPEQESINYDLKRDGIIFVGGFGHKPNVDGVMWFHREVYPILIRKGFRSSIYIVGSKPPKEVLDLADDNIIITGFVSDEKLQEMLLNCRLTFVPLRFGAGMKGKVLEAMYSGLPVVTTTIGAEGLNLLESGIVVSDNAEMFADLIIEIYDNYDMAKIKSLMAQEYIQKKFGEQQLSNLFLSQIEKEREL